MLTSVTANACVVVHSTAVSSDSPCSALLPCPFLAASVDSISLLSSPSPLRKLPHPLSQSLPCINSYNEIMVCSQPSYISHTCSNPSGLHLILERHGLPSFHTATAIWLCPHVRRHPSPPALLASHSFLLTLISFGEYFPGLFQQGFGGGYFFYLHLKLSSIPVFFQNYSLAETRTLFL